MRILFFLTYYTPHISGPVKYIERLAKELEKQGNVVSILTSKHPPNLSMFERKNGTSIFRIPVLIHLGKGVIMPHLIIKAPICIGRSDIVVVNLPQLEAGFIALWCKIFNKPLVAIHHTDLSGWNGWWHRLSEGITNLSGKLACSIATIIIPYTNDYAKNSDFLRPYFQKVSPLFPLVNRRLPSQQFTQKLISRFPKTNNTKYIGYSGRIAKQKKLEDAIAALDILNKSNHNYQWKLLLAGPLAIGETYGQNLIASIKNRQDISWLKALNDQQLSAFYQHLDALVLPSNDRLESFGLVQIEAMINGCPVVATDLPGARIPIGLTGMGKLVPPNQPLILADAIASVVADPTFCSPDKIRKVKTVFSPPKTTSKFSDLLEQIQRNHCQISHQRHP